MYPDIQSQICGNSCSTGHSSLKENNVFMSEKKARDYVTTPVEYQQSRSYKHNDSGFYFMSSAMFYKGKVFQRDYIEQHLGKVNNVNNKY